MELFVFLSFLSLFSVLPALAQVQHTYWVDQSCSGADITAIIEDAMNMAKRGTMRLNSGTDSDYAKVFERIFKAPKTDQTAFNKVNGIFGKPETPPGPGTTGNVRYGIAGMIPEPNNDRAQASLRIYCDDDPQDVNGNSRWTLRPDPPNPPPGYTPQAQRPRFSDSQPGEEYQVWEDLLNGILMGRTGGCKDANTAAETYTIMRPGTTGQANPRATMTICHFQLNRPIQHLGNIPLKKDISKIINPDDTDQEAGVQAFNAMTSMVVMHEFTHLPGFDIEDLQSPNDPNDRAYGWDDVLDLRNRDDSLNNADNYAYCALFAVLMDRHFRLSKIENEAQFGKLVYDRNGITSRLMVRELVRGVERGVEKVKEGLWRRGWVG